MNNSIKANQALEALETIIESLRAQNRDLLAALEASLPYLPSCPEKGKKGENCGPRFPYKPECPYMVARAAIAAVERE